MPTFNFTTGSTMMPDVGSLSYNGCSFSPLFESSISGSAIEDEAGRTVKYTKLLLSVDGYVTLGNRLANDISPTMTTLHQLLTAQAGALTYKGRGFDLVINANVKGSNRDVAWGPVPKLIEFQPLGSGLSAKVKWQVEVHVSAMKAGKGFRGIGLLELLQFNYDTSVSYGEDGFSILTVRGTLEIPLTRQSQNIRKIGLSTADNFRGVIERQVLSGIDLGLFHVTEREFNVSRDKRTLTWNYVVEEKPYMDLPPYCTIARGSYNVRPVRTGPGLTLWLCTMQASYTLGSGQPRRMAWFAFLGLMRLRMGESIHGIFPNERRKQRGGKKPASPLKVFFEGAAQTLTLGGLANLASGRFKVKRKDIEDVRKAILIDFSATEGLYLDSKTVAFSATWRLCTTFDSILTASGMWAKLNEKSGDGRNLWASTMRNYSGVRSSLENRLDPNLDVIIDFGS